MTVLKRFEMPLPGAGGDIVEVALAQLNAVKVSEDQLRHGYRIIVTGEVEASVSAFERLWTFARAENLYPPDVAAEAIAIRAGWLRNFIALGGDPEIEWDYARFAASPILVSDLGTAGPEDEEDDDEVPW